MSRLSFFVLMAVAGFLAVTVGVTDAVALSGDQNCDPSNECVYDYTQPSASRRWKYNFSSLCSGTDYVFHNATKGYVVVDDVHAACINRSCAHALTASRHVYYANVCGTASQNCLRECCVPLRHGCDVPHTSHSVHVCVLALECHSRLLEQHVGFAARQALVVFLVLSVATCGVPTQVRVWCYCSNVGRDPAMWQPAWLQGQARQASMLHRGLPGAGRWRSRMVFDRPVQPGDRRRSCTLYRNSGKCV